MGLNLSKWIKDRESQVRDVFDANTKADQQKRLAAGQPRFYQQQHSQGAAGRLGTGVGLGAIRSGVGAVQGVTDLYDLLTPGKGTNRASQALSRFAKSVDDTATAEHAIGYKPAQTATDIASLAIPAVPIAKIASKLPGAAKVAAKAAPVIDRLPKADAAWTVNGAPVVKSAEKTAPTVTKKAGQKFTKVAEPTRGKKTKLKEAFIDEDQHIIDTMRAIDKANGLKNVGRGDTHEERFLFNSGVQRRANSIGTHHFEKSVNAQEAVAGLNKAARQDFGTYANARRELQYDKKYKTSLPRKELKAIVKAGDATHGSRYDALNRYYQELADLRYKAGLINKETRDAWHKNDYIRIQRDMEDLVNRRQGSGNSYSRPSTAASQSVRGSKRKALDPIHTAQETAQLVHNEIASNETAKHLMEVLGKSGNAKALIKADNVKIRQESWKFLHDTREGKQQVNRLLKQHSKKLRGLQGEVDRLNKQGLDIRLKTKAPVQMKPVLSGVKDKVKGAGTIDKKDIVIDYGKDNPGNVSGRAKVVTKNPGAKTGTVVTDQFSRKANANEVRKLVKQLVTEDPKKLAKIKRKLTVREPRLKALIDDVEKLKNESEAFATARGEAFQRARQAADAATTHKNTIASYKDGIKQVSEVSTDMKRSVERINPFELTTTTNVLAAPGRVFRAATTGLDPVFTVTNYVKDQLGSAIMSKSAHATHTPEHIVSGLQNAFKDVLGIEPNNPIWNDFIKSAGDQTSYDMTRSTRSANRSIRSMQGGAGNKTINIVSNPIRSLEDLNSATEKATRFQNFEGTYKQAIKEGMSHEQAHRAATLAAWQHSVDFNRTGSWTRMLNLLIPYFNPGVQGTRQLVRSASQRPLATAGKTIGTLMTPVVAATVWNTSDPERKAVYDNLSDYEKEHNIIIIPPGTNAKTSQNGDKSYDVWKLPLPPGIGSITGIGRRLVEAHAAKQPLDFPGMAQDVAGTVSGPLDTHGPGQLANSLDPQWIKPGLTQAMNKDLFTGKQVVPDYMNEAAHPDGSPVSESEKAYKFTSGTARLAGQLTNTSPLRIEKAIGDTFGTVGKYGLDAADNLLALHAGDKPFTAKNESDVPIGGTSPQEKLSRKFAKASGKEDMNPTPAQVYFKDVSQAKSKLPPQDQKAWDTLHPSGKNFLGEKTYESDSTYNSAARLDIYNRFPKVFAMDKQLDNAARKRGEPGNPLFALTDWQVKKVLEKQNLPPGAKDAELSNLRKQDWYHAYQDDSRKYFATLKDRVGKDLAKAKKAGDAKQVEQLTATLNRFNNPDNPYPEAPAGLQKAMDYYNTLEKGTGARSSWIDANPGTWAEMQDYYAAVDNWQNDARFKRGLDATEGLAGKDAGYGSYSYNDGGTSTSGSGYARSARGSKTKSAGSAYEYAVSLKSGHVNRSKIATKPTRLQSRRGKTAGVTKPKVTMKKARI